RDHKFVTRLQSVSRPWSQYMSVDTASVDETPLGRVAGGYDVMAVKCDSPLYPLST
ncbi:hypothetical protein Pmani_027010, partial [Petrolisthes manimaculis]